MDEIFKTEEEWTKIDAVKEHSFRHENGLIVDFDLKSISLRLEDGEFDAVFEMFSDTQSIVEKLNRCQKFPDDIRDRVEKHHDELLRDINNIIEEVDEAVDFESIYTNNSYKVKFIDENGEEVQVSGDVFEKYEEKTRQRIF